MSPWPGTGARRVLVVSRVGFIGGVERIILTLADGIDSYGWSPVLACPKVGGLADSARAQGTVVAPFEFNRMRITADPLLLLRYPSALWSGAAAIERVCVEHRIDLIHAHHPVTALYSLIAARKLRIPLVLHVHETLPARLGYGLAMRVVVNRVAMMPCVSKAAQELALALGASPSQTRIVPNGVDPAFLYPREAGLPPEMAHAGRGPHIGVFGVLEPRKAQHVLLEAACEVLPIYPDARFWLVGSTALKDKQSYADRLRAMADAYPLRHRVAFVGFQSDVRSWLAAMDVVVQPSVALESFGMALAEALVLGRPVIASAVGGVPEVVLDEDTGVLVPPGDAHALAGAIQRLLASSELRRRFGVRGAEDARIRFAPELFKSNIAAIYDAALGIKSSQSGMTHSTLL